MLSTLLLGACSVASTPPKPHVIFILADDLGSADVGWNDPTVLTPEIDALAKDGVILTHLYTVRVGSTARSSTFASLTPARTRPLFVSGAGVLRAAARL